MPLNNILKEFEERFPFWKVGQACMQEPTDESQDIKEFVSRTYNAGRDSREEEIVGMIGEIEEDIEGHDVHADEALETLKNKILKK